eukprot:8092056-Karenia_brevis.AAC.1
MRRTFEEMFGKLNEEEIKMEDFEENEARAERLSETVGGSGAVKIKKGAHDRSMPKSSEELRARLTMMGDVVLSSLQIPAELAGENDYLGLARYANFPLGPKTYGLRM